MLNDTLADALSAILNAEKIGKPTVEIKPTSKIIEAALEIISKKGYIGSFEKVQEIGGTKLTLNLIGKVNKCGAIKPRYAIKFEEIEKFEKRFLPAKDFGIIIISTSQGILTNDDARKKKIGGKLLAYCY
ncbi:30S ribosomal protein S8 [Candidatus Woesearchaeota archaeon]|jgi:small subunit ribosomal protein S8|nr:30S ribosomal protein S8 [Candidatus Woesearchaeota archaeon]MBT4368705.1 30S ribosomal protein S8 [Candidatus Woesearchaeota archaeon]MBT4711994.1 30S ribosomal protein S8 [Candidatus Woesearchaeota archaeon]MBT6638889.1 30S ribosomal protein S8 [Candidatus Woesearchaeota archaeon]MBT7134533.1 30S ribosomal protein S8 [Candidatus Woesearchaeota archaeon]